MSSTRVFTFIPALCRLSKIAARMTVQASAHVPAARAISCSALTAAPTPASRSKALSFRGLYYNKTDGSLHVRHFPAKFAISKSATDVNMASLVKQGRILLEIAPGSSTGGAEGTVSYDWTKKAQIYLSAYDLMYLGSTPMAQTDVRIGRFTPEGEAPVRGISFSPTKNGFWKLTIASSFNKQVVEASVSLAQNDVIMLRHLFNNALPYVNGWIYNLNPQLFDPAYNLADAVQKPISDDAIPELA